MDTTKLPKWARDRIAQLEAQLANARAQLALGPADSDVWAGGPEPRPIGKGTRVEFRVPAGLMGTQDRGVYRAYMDEEGVLHVSASVSSVDVHPVAANSIEVDLVAPSWRDLEAARRFQAEHGPQGVYSTSLKP